MRDFGPYFKGLKGANRVPKSYDVWRTMQKSQIGYKTGRLDLGPIDDKGHNPKS